MKIALDAGHGKDTYTRTGSKGVPGLEEFEFNSVVVAEAKKLLEQRGFEVVLTQPLDGDSVALQQRTALADQEGVKALVSIHADANASSQVRGHWCFYWHDHAASKHLAEIWLKHADKLLPNPSRGLVACRHGFWANFHIVRVPAIRLGIPAILCEYAFMTNPDDLKLLQSKRFRNLCAEVTARTLCEYFGVSYKSDSPQLNEWQWEAGTKALEELHRLGIVSNPEYWKKHLDQPVPAWLFWEMLRRLAQQDK